MRFYLLTLNFDMRSCFYFRAAIGVDIRSVSRILVQKGQWDLDGSAFTVCNGSNKPLTFIAPGHGDVFAYFSIAILLYRPMLLASYPRILFLVLPDSNSDHHSSIAVEVD